MFQTLLQWLRDCYCERQLRRWIRLRVSEEQFYTDAAGKIWCISELVQAKLLTQTQTYTVNQLWEQNRQEQVWGPHLPSLEDAYREILRGSYLNYSICELFRSIDLSGSWEDHLSRITLFVTSLRRGYHIPPMILGSDRLLWDGFHRLVAYRLSGQHTVQVVILDDTKNIPGNVYISRRLPGDNEFF